MFPGGRFLHRVVFLLEAGRSCSRRRDRHGATVEISQLALDANNQIFNATSPGQVLNDILNRFLGWPCKAAPGKATDRENAITETFASLVYVASDPGALREPVTVSADALAAVIEMSEQMDLPKFRAAYQKIAFAKSLKKTPAPRLKGTAHTNTTLGIILAIRSEVPLEKLAEELDKLNRETPSNQWPDMVTVLSKGTINLAGQFPGEQVSADILPPAEGALEAYTPPMYFVMVIRPTGSYSFNKMAASLWLISRYFRREQRSQFSPRSLRACHQSR
jgi:hypothetical protein